MSPFLIILGNNYSVALSLSYDVWFSFSPFLVSFYAAQMVPLNNEMKITHVPVVVAVSYFS